MKWIIPGLLRTALVMRVMSLVIFSTLLTVGLLKIPQICVKIFNVFGIAIMPSSCLACPWVLRDPRVVLDPAFAVAAAFTFVEHLACTISFDGSYVLPVIVEKLTAGIFAMLIA